MIIEEEVDYLIIMKLINETKELDYRNNCHSIAYY
jgi:hypothetical protein